VKLAALQSDVKVKDLELWKSWKRSKDPSVLQQLLNQMNPIINREVNRWAASMSRSLLEAEGRRLAVKAFNEYDPNHGAALSTFVASRLPKLSRLVYANQNTARLSETKALLFHSYNSAMNELKDRHGREPTSDELADHLGWSPKKLADFQKQSARKEFIESEEHPDFDDSESDHMVDFIYHDLTPLQKKIFEYTTGYQGSPKLTGAQITKKLAITQGQLSYQKSLIVKNVEKVRGSHGH
jgi:DNA-directed RNA polymerase specialized sigma subunit